MMDLDMLLDSDTQLKMVVIHGMCILNTVHCLHVVSCDCSV